MKILKYNEIKVLREGTSNIVLTKEEKDFLKACEKNNMNVVRKYLEDGGNINVTDNDGWSAFMLASEQDHFEIVQFLDRNGANVNAKNFHFFS